jgi:hypothetical protein
MGKKEKIVPTLQPKEEVVQQAQEMLMVPVEVDFHVAGINVSKYQTPQGNLTVLSLQSPIGVAVNVKLNDESVNDLIKELAGSKVDVFKTLPGLVA